MEELGTAGGIYAPVFDILSAAVIAAWCVIFWCINKRVAFIAGVVLLILGIAAIAFSMFLSGQNGQAVDFSGFEVAGAAIGFAAGMYIGRAYIKFPIKTKSLLGQIVKAIVGLISVLAVQEVLIWNFDPGPLQDMFRYFVLTIWITVIYPYAIKRFFPEEEGGG